MASSVFYKFKSQKDESRVTFDGTGISVFDLKKEVILANNLGKANDFDLAVYDSSSGEEYKDDAHIIPRSSSVIVKRMPARPGKGKAAMYIGSSGSSSTATADSASKSSVNVSGQTSWHRAGNISKRFDHKEVKEESAAAFPKPPPITVKSAVTKEDEAAAMAAMFQAQTANWEETQEKMSQLVSHPCGFLVYVVGCLLMNVLSAFIHIVSTICTLSAVRVYTNTRGTHPRGGKPYQPAHHHQPDRPLPPSYVCYRCGQKGHWIQDCPTNNDREFDNRPRIKRTTGIPRSFLKAVDNPATGQLGQGVMVTPEGGYVVAQPDSASWQKQVSRPKGLTEADIRERAPTDASLTCPIDNKLFRDAVKTPCCGTLYCEECIQTHLLERDFICPNCAKKIPSLDKLIIDKPMRAKVSEYIDNEIEKSRHEGEEEEGPTSHEETTGGEKSYQNTAPAELAAFDQEYYAEQQTRGDINVSQIIAESIPQLQAQISQIQIMLNNLSLPNQVRQQAQMKHQQLQMELQQAQVAAAMAATFPAAAAAATGMPFPSMQGGGFPTRLPAVDKSFPNQQPAGQDSAYQRLPLNNRRRNLKRERPSDFLEVGGNEGMAKVPRYWE
ncbi:putative RING finger protein P8B7.15c [Grifola frondosa]|uniref:Putative RING finger protein P8B7.15c n=1 Tax=Grifola frondosa TaxID=5627 RepID=A0A1C7M9N3_GRIFR|nr:putative RING finger protein P8B7.15c [Grifola frondosa]